MSRPPSLQWSGAPVGVAPTTQRDPGDESDYWQRRAKELETELWLERFWRQVWEAYAKDLEKRLMWAERRTVGN